MYVYIQWKICSLENTENKIIIYDISKEQNKNNEYQKSTIKNNLCKIKIDFRLNQEQIYYTRLKIDEPLNNILYNLVVEKYDSQGNIFFIELYLTHSIKSRTQIIKKIINDYNNHHINDVNLLNNYYEKTEILTKSINLTNHGEFINCIGNKHIFKNYIYQIN